MRLSDLENALASELQFCEIEGLLSPKLEQESNTTSKNRKRDQFEALHSGEDGMEQRRTAPRRRRILAGDSDGIRESSITEPRPTVEESNSKER